MSFKLNLSDWIPSKRTNQLQQSETTALSTQVGVLKAHLQGAEQHIACQEQKIGELSTKLETETEENKSLWKQVEDTNNLEKEKNSRLVLNEQLLQQQDGHQQDTEQLLQQNNTKQQQLEELQQHNITLQQELEAEKESHAETVKDDQELIQQLRGEQDVLCQEMESLKHHQKEMAATNLMLSAKLRTEQEVCQALKTETVELKEELKELEEAAITVIQQTLEKIPVTEDSEEKLPEKKKKHSVWKRIRHFFGLRKRNEERQEKESPSN